MTSMSTINANSAFFFARPIATNLHGICHVDVTKTSFHVAIQT